MSNYGRKSLNLPIPSSYKNGAPTATNNLIEPIKILKKSSERLEVLKNQPKVTTDDFRDSFKYTGVLSGKANHYSLVGQ